MGRIGWALAADVAARISVAVAKKIYYVDGKATEDIAKYTYNSRNQLLKVVQHERGDVHALLNEYTYDAKGRMIYHVSGYDIVLVMR